MAGDQEEGRNHEKSACGILHFAYLSGSGSAGAPDCLLSAGYQGFPSAFVRKKNRLLRLDRPDPCGDLQCVSLAVLAGEPPKFIKIGLTCPGLEDNLMRDEEDRGQFSCRACATLGTK
jgi:hypothetical protein